MARIEAAAISFRPLQVRLRDVVEQIGAAREFTLHVLDGVGARRAVRLELVEKWGAGSWRWELCCRKCRGPARVLHLDGDSMACNRCSHYLTPHQRHKRASTWATEGALAEKLMRAASSGGSSAVLRKRVANQLRLNTSIRAASVIELAERMTRAADELPQNSLR